MGGTGSGRWAYHDKKRTVEECWAIGISEIARGVDLSKPGSTCQALRPTTPTTGKSMCPLRITPQIGEDCGPFLRFSYTIDGKWGIEHRVDEVVRLQTTRPNFGGVRWWLSCPRMVGGKECGRRAGKLYRAPGTPNFACRRCLDLTYESCQKSHRYDGLFAVMAAETPGLTPEIIKAAFVPPASIRAHNKSIDQRLLRAFEEVFLK